MKLFLCTLVIALCAMTALGADLSGKWSGTFTPEGNDGNAAFAIIKQAGTTLSGSAGPDENQQWPFTGKVDGNKITGEVKSPEGDVYKLDLILEGDHLKGDVIATHDGQTMKGKLDLARVKS